LRTTYILAIMIVCVIEGASIGLDHLGLLGLVLGGLGGLVLGATVVAFIETFILNVFSDWRRH